MSACRNRGCGRGQADVVGVFLLTALVVVYDDKDAKGDKVLVPSTTLELGDTIEFSARPGEDELKNDISVWVNGVKNAEFHTSCSKPLGPGIKKGDFTVVTGVDKDGNALCPFTDCVLCGDDGEADKVSELTFESPVSPSNVRIFNDKEAKLEDELDLQVDGNQITVKAPSDDDELNNEISIYVGGTREDDRVAVFHTSCSQLIGPGTEEGGFVVVSGRDKNGRLLCEVDLTDCVECGTGADDAEKLSELRFKNISNGELKGVAVYNDKDAKTEDLLFGPQDVPSGNEFTVEAPVEKDEFDGDISIWVDNERNTTIHTSCSQPIGRGIVKGDFEIIGGADKSGRPLCPEPIECAQCGDGGEADGISRLTFRTDEDPDDVTIYNDKEAKGDKMLETQVAGDQITVTPLEDKDKLESELSIYVNGSRVADFHTSCSQLIGPGISEGGFEIVSGRDSAGRALCPVEDDDGPTGCVECGSGEDDADKVSELTFEVPDGVSLSDINVYNDKDAKTEDLLDKVDNGDGTFTVSAPSDKNEFETDISVWIGSNKNTEIHTSCSKPLGPGLVKGDFLITGAKDKNGRTLCELGCVECGVGADDADKVSQLTLENNSGGTATVYNDKEAKEDAELDLEVNGDLITFSAPDGEDDFNTDISVYVDGNFNTTIHTSCSRPLGVGDTFGDFVVRGGRDKNGLELCGSI